MWTGEVTQELIVILGTLDDGVTHLARMKADGRRSASVTKIQQLLS